MNPFIKNNEILENNGKEWLEFEANKFSFVVLFFFTENDESIRHLDEYNKYCQSNNYVNKNNGVVYGVYSNMSQDEANKIKADYQLSFDLVKNSSCDLGYANNMVVLNNKTICDGICVFVNRKYFKKNTKETYIVCENIYQIRKMFPDTDKNRTPEQKESDKTLYNEYEYELCKPTPESYILTYGNLISEFKNKYYSRHTGILKSFPRSHSIIRCVTMINSRISEDIQLANKLDNMKQSALKRLMRDYIEMRTNKIDGIDAYLVSDDNLFEWHVNIDAPQEYWYYQNKKFHLTILFDQMYPLRPPKIRAVSPLPHPNIFGEYICLDLLTDYYDEGESKTKFGWSTAYSLYSILITLQAFINDGIYKLIYCTNSEYDITKKNINSHILDCVTKKFRCTCALGHDYANDESSIQIPNVVQEESQEDDTNPFESYKFIESLPSSLAIEKKNEHVGQTYKGTITNVMKFGAFVDFNMRNISCMIPVGEYDLDIIPKNGMEVNVKIIDVKPADGRNIKLVGSLKLKKEKVGKIAKGKVIELNDEKRQVIFENASDPNEKYFATESDVANAFKPHMFCDFSEVMKIGDMFDLQIKMTSSGNMHPCQIIKNPLRENHKVKNSTLCLNSDDSALTKEINEKNLVCFHSKASYKEDILGYGVTIEYYDDGNLSYIHPTCLDFISLTSFDEHKIRKSAWKNQFTHFLPLYLSKGHAKDLSIHEKFISYICQNKDYVNNPKRMTSFNPNMIIKVLPALMNTFVVTFMNGSTYESINALSAYVQIYRLLLAFCAKYPEIRQYVDSKVNEMIKNPETITKKIIQSIGELFPLIALSSFQWNDMAIQILTEIFDRNVKWLTLKYPELGKINQIQTTNVKKIISSDSENYAKEIIKMRRSLTTKYQELSHEDYIAYKKHVDDLVSGKDPRLGIDGKVNTDWNKIDQGRIPKTFIANQVSLKLIMFHVYFLNTFRSQQSANDDLFSISKIIDKSHGRTPAALENDFQKQVKIIKDIDNFNKFFKYISIPPPSDESLLKWLRESVLNSFRKRYHYVTEKKKVKVISHAKKVKPTLNVDDL